MHIGKIGEFAQKKTIFQFIISLFICLRGKESTSMLQKWLLIIFLILTYIKREKNPRLQREYHSLFWRARSPKYNISEFQTCSKTLLEERRNCPCFNHLSIPSFFELQKQKKTNLVWFHNSIIHLEVIFKKFLLLVCIGG